MIYKAKDNNLYKVRSAKREDILNIIRVHSSSARKTYAPFKQDYPVLYKAFSSENLLQSWNSYFDKCEQSDKQTTFVIEKLYYQDNKEKRKIVGVAKAGMLSPQYKEHMEEVLGSKMSETETNQYANLQTIYIDNDHQGIGLGKAIMGHFANTFSKRGCKYAITETLKGYEDSPKFFNKVGGAECLGEYRENSGKAVSNQSKNNEEIPLNLWLMPNIQKMKMQCYFQQTKIAFYNRKNTSCIMKQFSRV